MAGEWIKMRTDLPADPTVFRLAELLGVDELHVVGCLFCFWAWADKHAVDGHVDGATSRMVDKVSCRDGFADAMISVGWLIVDTTGIKIPKFDRHNGESAKERGLKNARQAKWRAGKDSAVAGHVDAKASTKASTREEKRREEGISPLPPSGETKAKSVRGTRLPENWGLDASHETGMTEDIRLAAKQLKTELEADWTSGTVRYHLNEFRNHFHASAQRNAVKLDWLAAWRNWCSKAMREMPSADPVRRDRQAAAARQAEAVAA